MPRSGYDTTGVHPGAPGGQTAQRAQNRRNGGSTPRATGLPSPIGPPNDPELTPRAQPRPHPGPRPSVPLDPYLAFSRPAHFNESSVRNHLADRITGPRVPKKGQGKKNPSSSETAGAAEASTGVSGQVGQAAMTGRKRPSIGVVQGQQSGPKKPATDNNNVAGGARTLSAQNVFPGQGAHLPANPIISQAGIRPATHAVNNPSFVSQPYANTAYGSQPFVYPQVHNHQNFPFDASMNQNNQSVDPAALTYGVHGLNGFNSPNMASQSQMTQGYGAVQGFNGYGAHVQNMPNQGFTPQSNWGRGGNGFNGFQNTPNQQGNPVNLYNSSHPSFTQTQQQSQMNHFSGPSNTFGQGSMPNNQRAPYRNPAQHNMQPGNQQNMQSGAQGNTQSHNQGFMGNFQTQAYNSNIWGQQSMSNIDPQLQPASPATAVQQRGAPQLNTRSQATGRGAVPRMPDSQPAPNASLGANSAASQAAQTSTDNGDADETMADVKP